MSTFVIQNIVRWPEYNEYEGQMTGTFDQHLVTVYVQMYSGNQWDLYAPGDQLTASLWLERDGAIERMVEPTLPGLKQQQGANYQVGGQVIFIEGEQVYLDVGFPLRVDMDWPVTGRERFPAFGVGDWLRVVGVLRLSLDGEEE